MGEKRPRAPLSQVARGEGCGDSFIELDPLAEDGKPEFITRPEVDRHCSCPALSFDEAASSLAPVPRPVNV